MAKLSYDQVTAVRLLAVSAALLRTLAEDPAVPLEDLIEQAERVQEDAGYAFTQLVK